jgi:hypothetical protein
MSRQNILSGFKKSGIHPLDADIFSEADFLTSSVTDRENPALENHTHTGRSSEYYIAA